jgi:hypothetical protein
MTGSHTTVILPTTLSAKTSHLRQSPGLRSPLSNRPLKLAMLASGQACPFLPSLQLLPCYLAGSTRQCSQENPPHPLSTPAQRASLCSPRHHCHPSGDPTLAKVVSQFRCPTSARSRRDLHPKNLSMKMSSHLCHQSHPRLNLSPTQAPLYQTTSLTSP